MEAIPEILHLQAGSQEAFRQLVEAYQQMVYSARWLRFIYA